MSIYTKIFLINFVLVFSFAFIDRIFLDDKL